MVNELTALVTQITRFLYIGNNTVQQGANIATALVAAAVMKFLFVIVTAVIAYKIAKIWLARLYPDKGKFALVRDSLFTTVALLVGFAAWRIF